jgi:hypothetical protein
MRWSAAMSYEQFKELWLSSIGEAGLKIAGASPIEETLDLHSTDRRCKSSVVLPGEQGKPFYVSAGLEFRWDALQAARTRTTEDDLVRELFGVDRSQYPRTEAPGLRVDVTLHASTLWGSELPFPSTEAWKSWAREVRGRLQNVEPILPIEQVRENRKGNLEILAWRDEPKMNAICKPDGTLVLSSVEFAAGVVIGLPRRWDDSSRKPDRGPHEELAALLRRLAASLQGWTQALDHFAPTN